MDKKVTRRVAIGTIIGGIAAAPIVYYALKFAYAPKPPRSKFEKEWAKVVEMLDIPIQQIDGPSSFTLDYKPQIGAKFRAICLNASYDSSPAEYPQPPDSYSLSTGQVTPVSPIVANRPALLVNAEKRTYRTRNYHKEYPGAECVVVPTKDHEGIDYYEAGGGKPKKIPIEKVNNPCANLACELMFNYPQVKSLVKGEKWTNPKTAENWVELSCEITGFFKVAGKATMKITAEKHSSNQDIQDRLNGIIKKETEEEQRASLKQHLERIIKEERTETFEYNVYVDLKTGLNVRYERKWTTYHPKEPKRNSLGTTINQMLEG